MNTQTITRPGNLLRRAMRGNAIFSAGSGLVCLVAAGPLATFTGLERPVIFVILGLALLGYAADLFWVTSRETVARKYGWAAVVMDTAWVVGSLLILLAGWPALTVAGKWTVALLAEVVAAFAVIQAIGLRQQA